MNITVLGATGSIGTQALDVVRTCLPKAKIKVLTGNKNIPLLASLVKEFTPELVWVPDGSSAKLLLEIVKCNIVTGEDGLICSATHDTDIVVNALVGKAGLAPTLAAIKAGRDVALANKESLVTAGSLIMQMAREKNIRITPIDSEHSAILQCLQGSYNGNDVEKIILTASGGPFRTWAKERISKATAALALRHPNWSMGPKITVDSATMMNKGLELIEAMWLFDMPLDNIEILVHPQSIIHSMVQFVDGVVMAQMGVPDMRLPILYALSGACRAYNNFPRLDFMKISGLSFEAPDIDRFPCLALAQHAAKVGGTLPAVMNTVNEWAVGQYLQNKLDFYGISALIAEAFDSYTVKEVTSLDDILDAENWANEFVKK